MKNQAPNIATLTKLVEALRIEHEKTGLLLQEVDRVLTGGEGIGKKMQRVMRAFSEAWAERYAPGVQNAYVWVKGKDQKAIKDLLQAMPVEEIEARCSRYLADDEPFVAMRRHPFGLFANGRINQYAPPGAAPEFTLYDADGPVDCRHTPRCKTDAACTAKRRKEMRT